MESFTFTRKERIKKGKEFKDVYTGGRKKVGSFFVLYWKKNGLSYHRLGVSVSKKIGGAVVRSRIKRIFRETFRQIKPKVGDGVDCVLVARRRMRTISAGVFSKEYYRLLQTEGLIGNDIGDTR